MKKWMLIPALAGVVAIGGVALADGTSSAPSGTAAKQMLTLQQAKELAIQEVGGFVKEIELDKRKSGPVFEVEIDSKGVEYELDIDALSGKVTIVSQESQVSDSIKAKLISEEQAQAAAKQMADGNVVSIELDDDDDHYYYETNMKDSRFVYKVKVDAVSGEVVKFDRRSLKAQEEQQSSKTLTADEALAIAKKRAAGDVESIELDREDGRRVYEIVMRDDQYEYEMTIDAATGEWMEFEKELVSTKEKRVQAVKPAAGNTLQVTQTPATPNPVVSAQPPSQPQKQKQEAKHHEKQEKQQEKQYKKHQEKLEKQQRKQQKQEQKAANKKAAISKDQAIAIARQHASGKVTDIELDDGVWEIEMEDGDVEYELEINAYTGALLSFEMDD